MDVPIVTVVSCLECGCPFTEIFAFVPIGERMLAGNCCQAITILRDKSVESFILLPAPVSLPMMSDEDNPGSVNSLQSIHEHSHVGSIIGYRRSAARVIKALPHGRDRRLHSTVEFSQKWCQRQVGIVTSPLMRCRAARSEPIRNNSPACRVIGLNPVDRNRICCERIDLDRVCRGRI